MSSHRSKWWRRTAYAPGVGNGPAASTVDIIGEAATKFVDVGNGHSHDQGNRLVLESVNFSGIAGAATSIVALQSVEDPDGTPTVRTIASWPLVKAPGGDFIPIAVCHEFEGGLAIPTRASSSITKTAKLRLALFDGAGAARNFSLEFGANLGALSVVCNGYWLPADRHEFDGYTGA